MSPLLLSTWSFGLRGHRSAWPPLAAGGSSLDAVETVCRVLDADPEIDSVGYGGYPDAAGQVTLDGSIMLSPAQCGSACVCARHLHPVSIARLVMERTPHVMLAGPGADDFADEHGLPASALLHEPMLAKWRQWKQRPVPVDQSRDKGLSRPIDRGDGGRLFGPGGADAGHDTIGALALDARGVLAGACSTSGVPWKQPGRVGDSPIIGAGLYVDPRCGAATATGWGELMLGSCTSFLVVECMRRGATPAEAVAEALRRIAEDHVIEEQHQVGVIALRPDGGWAAGALKDGFMVSVTDTQGDRVEPVAVQATARPRSDLGELSP